MEPAIARRLIELNQAFYEDFAAEFSDSRRRLNPGIERALDAMTPFGALLDLGCGDARVGHAWAAGRFPGPVRYLGVDRSPSLLGARPGAAALELLETDLATPDWPLRVRAQATFPAEGFSTVVCFSVLHHLPGRRARQDFLWGLRGLLAPEGRWAVSVWQFLHLPRLRRRVLEWSEAGLGADQVEPGDLLLDWLRGGRGLRYVHHYEPAELLEDCVAAGLTPATTFSSDGETGDLGLYASNCGA